MPILIAVGLVASYIVLAHLYSELNFRKLVPLILATYFSLTSVLGVLLESIQLSWNNWYFFLTYVMISGIGYLFLKKRGRGNLHIIHDTRSDLIYLLIIIVATMYLVYPAYPDFYPIAFAEDAPRHFELTYYIQQTWMQPKRIDHSWSVITVPENPYAMHLNIALLSSSFGVPLIRFIFPFLCLIVALTAMGLLEMVKHAGKLAYMTPFLFVTSPPINHSLSRFGTWSSLFGGFLVITFILVLKDYYKEFSFKFLFFLILLESSIILSYPAWSVVCLSAFLLTLATAKNKGRIAHGALFALSPLVVTAPVWIARLHVLGTRLGDLGGLVILPGGIPEVLQVQRAPVILLGIIGITTTSLKEDKRLFHLLGGSLVFPLMLYTYSKVISQVSTYYYYKTYLFLEYSLTAFAAIGLVIILEHINAHKKKYQLKPLFLILIVLLSAVQIRVLEETRFRTQSVTESDYRTALWIKENLPPDTKLNFRIDVSYTKGKIYWILALTNRSFDKEKTGKIIITDIKELSSPFIAATFPPGQYELLFKDDDNTVLMKTEIEE